MMPRQTFTEFLLEGGQSNVPLIVVDIQPAYGSHCLHILQDEKFQELLENQKEIIWFFNGEDLGLDSKSALIQWLLDYAISEDVIDKIEFKEKSYGFLRSWMDMNVEDRIIIKAIRLMITNRENDFRDLDPEYVERQLGNDFQDIEEYMDDAPYIPDISIKELKKLSGAYICGGGKSECLREIELLMSAVNSKYKEIRDFMY